MNTIGIPWATVVVAVLLAPVACALSLAWGLPSGVATLLLQLGPVLVAALSGARRDAVLTAVIAALACVLEAVVVPETAARATNWGSAMLCVGLLLGLSGAVISVVEPMQRAWPLRKGRHQGPLAELYLPSRDDGPRPAGGPGAAARDEPRELLDDETVNYRLLLLTLQDVSRRISSHLDPDTLVPTILSTASSTLQCTECRLYLWNGPARVLKLAGELAAPGKVGAYVPHPDRGAAAWVLAERQILTRRDLDRDESLRGLLDDGPHPADAIAPLAVGGEVLALLVLHGARSESPNFSQLLHVLSSLSALALKNAQLFKRIEDMARRDGLTGLLNHASFHESLVELVEAAERDQRPLTVIMGDVDHFKRFNDTWGHQAGDFVLRETARLWQAVMPDRALIGRYGGEEFIAVLPDCDGSSALELAELLRSQLESFPMLYSGQDLHVTSSFGVAERSAGRGGADDVIRQADAALYRAKRDGRNRVCVAERETKACDEH